ncbi:MAG: hypothetical protein K6G63_05305 [Eubacterium sp.]|nr:hypothetical protein [Eubacterium sp.]
MKDSNSIFIGALFLVAAVLIVLNAMGYTMGIGPTAIVLSVVLAACLIKSLVKLSFGGVLFSSAFLLIIYSQPLGIPEKLVPWPIILVAAFGTIGLNLIFRKSINRSKYKARAKEFRESHGNVFVENVASSDGDYVYEKNTFGGSTRYIKSQNLIHADISNSFGEMKVYFDGANITSEFATISVNNSFGETILYIPRKWEIENRVVGSFGSIDANTYSADEKVATVIIEGNVSFGELKIIYI